MKRPHLRREKRVGREEMDNLLMCTEVRKATRPLDSGGSSKSCCGQITWEPGLPNYGVGGAQT